MNHHEFVKELCTLPFEDSVYLNAGLDEEFIRENRNRYIAVERRTPGKSNTNFNDPIISLIQEYDVKNIEIGMINFGRKIAKHSSFIVFGTFELDRLAISIITKDIVLLPESSDEIGMYCAMNGQKFLESAIFIGKFLEKRGIDDNLYDDEDANSLIAEQCAELAGGSKYLNFYRMMLGICKL
jgi:hypothetical protein